MKTKEDKPIANPNGRSQMTILLVLCGLVSVIGVIMIGLGLSGAFDKTGGSPLSEWLGQLGKGGFMLAGGGTGMIFTLRGLKKK